MQRKFLFNLGLLVFLNLLVKPFYILGIDTEILVRVGQREYGLYFALLNLSFVLNIFLDMGTVNFNTSNIAKHHHLVSKHFGSVVTVRLFLSFAYLIICLASAYALGYDLMELKLLLPICLNQILAGLLMYFRSNLAGLQLFVRDSLISVLDRLVLIIACSAILWGRIFDLEISIVLFIYLQSMAYGLSCLVAFFVLRPHLSEIRLKFNMAFNLVILKKSFPYALLILLMSFYFRTDAVMLERMLDEGAYEAGIYAQAFRFYEAGNMLAYLFGALLFPMFAKLMGKKDEIAQLLNLSFRLIMVASVIAGLAGFYFSEEIMNLRFSSEVASSSKAFSFLMIAFTGICGTYVFGALLTASDKLRSLNYMALSGVLVNIVLNFLLIPKLKAEGAAIASMITQLLMTLVQIWLVKRLLDLGPERSTYLRLLVFIPVCIFMIYPVRWLEQDWISSISLYGLLSLISSFAIGLISIKNIRSYFSLIRPSGR